MTVPELPSSPTQTLRSFSHATAKWMAPIAIHWLETVRTTKPYRYRRPAGKFTLHLDDGRTQYYVSHASATPSSADCIDDLKHSLLSIVMSFTITPSKARREVALLDGIKIMPHIMFSQIMSSHELPDLVRDLKEACINLGAVKRTSRFLNCASKRRQYTTSCV